MINTDKPYRIFADVLEQEALNQFESAMQQPFVVRGALMPDAHTGHSLPIGAVVATEDVIVPSWVGYDIGCGMCAIPTTFKLPEVREKAKLIFNDIYKAIPVGFSHNDLDTDWGLWQYLPRTDKFNSIFTKNGLKQLGSLGGGNHFIEIGHDKSNTVWVIIHSGSRGIGHAVATYYMRLASGDGKAKEGHYGLDVESPVGKDYVKDMKFCLEFALENRREMLRRVAKVLSKHCSGMAEWNKLINRNHNHAEFKDGLWVHRKGATHAEKGMLGVIPGNMRDGSFIVEGKGNPESLSSSSHGAGRVLGRKEAKKTLDISQFEETMDGIVAKVDNDTLEESPFAYKNIFTVMEQQKDLVGVVAYIRPILNVKG